MSNGRDYYDALTNKKKRKAGERYGVSLISYGMGRPGEGGIQKKNPLNYGKDVADAAMNDYDTRRTIEAAAMSGKKKAEKYAKNGFKDLTDVTKANNMFAKMHKRQGNGGDFASNSDYAGLTYSMVQRDRNKLNESIDSRIAAIEDEQTDTAITPDDNVEYAVSQQSKDAKATLADWMAGLGPSGNISPYGANSASAPKAPSPYEEESSTPVTTDINEFVSDYKDDVKAAYRFKPTS